MIKTTKQQLRKQLPRSNNGHGFTIIEVIIVLAIAGFILLIVLLALPATQRNSRNYTRRHAVDYAASQLLEYKNDTGGLPATKAQGDAFVADYLSSLNKAFTFDFKDIGQPHSYVPPLDSIAIQYGHWCNRYGNGDAPTDPIAGNDANTYLYVIWTQLEASGSNFTYCVDNYGR